MPSKPQKWFSDLGSDTPISRAGLEVFAVRTKAVLDRADAIMETSATDKDDVHQLRVSTRRYAAALRAFEDILPNQNARRARKASSEFRRLAGDVRDLDVKRSILDEFFEELDWLKKPLQKATKRVLKKMRSSAIDELNESIKSRREEFAKVSTKIERFFDKKIDERVGKGSFGSLAKKQLGAQWVAMQEAGRQDLGDATHVHRLRIGGKRLRYGVEIFAGCLPAIEREEVYQRLESLQNQLGRINDLRNIFTTLARRRDRILARLSKPSDDLTEFQWDRFTATIGKEWFALQERFVSEWNEQSREEFEELVAEMLETETRRRDRKAAVRPIGFTTRRGVETPRS